MGSIRGPGEYRGRISVVGRFMTVREVAQRLEISVSLAYRLLASGSQPERQGDL